MVTALLIAARVVHLGAGMLLVSIPAFRWLVLLPGFAGATDEDWLGWAPLFRRLSGLWAGAGILAVLSGLSLFWAVSAGMSGVSLAGGLDAGTWSTVACQTQFGQVFVGRALVAVLLGAGMWILMREHWQRRRTRSPLEVVATLLAVIFLVSFSATGHAAASGSSHGPWNLLGDAVHLLAASIWPTGLLPFALLLHAALRVPGSATQPAFARMIARFSALSLITVGVLAGTGIINGIFLVGSWGALVSTTYGVVLMLKLALLGVVLAIAAGNRYCGLPALFSGMARREEGEVRSATKTLHMLVLTEFGLAAAILVVVGVLGITPPPPH